MEHVSLGIIVFTDYINNAYKFAQIFRNIIKLSISLRYCKLLCNLLQAECDFIFYLYYSVENAALLKLESAPNKINKTLHFES